MGRLLLLIFFGCFVQQMYCQTLERASRIENDSIYIDFINPFYAPLELKLSPLDSTKAYTSVNAYGVLKYRDTLKNAIILPLNQVVDTTKVNTKNYIDFKASFGDPSMTADKDYRYTLPYPKGKRYKIIQTFGGKFSHNKPHSRYAIDINTKVGDTITASRSGIVFFIKEDSKKHCASRKCMAMGNKLLVVHEDSTIAQYTHLDFEGALVNIGDTISVGQPIAISGMTGFTTTPHLHFVVLKSGGISIPVYFKGQKKKKLKQGKYYRRLN